VADTKKNQPDQPTPGFNPNPVHIGGESFADRVLPHLKKILVFVGIFAVVIGGFLVWRWVQHRGAEKATAALVVAVDTVDEPVAPPGEDGAEEPGFASHRERAEAALARLRQVRGDARSGAAMLEADLLVELGQLDEAERIYRKLARRRGLEGAVAREALGQVAEARAHAAEGPARATAFEQALEAYRAVQPEETGARRADALYHEGRVLAQLGRTADARTAFDQALAKAREMGDEELRSVVELRLLQLDAPPLPPSQETATP
jgi:predicted negative regulator of RcsB-dependent stress response